MNKQAWKPYVGFIALSEAVGALAGILTMDGVARYSAMPKPALSPPDVVFPVVWSILFALMGIGAARIFQSPASRNRTVALGAFFVQLVVNFFWSLLFFNAQAYGLSFAWLVLLWVLILWMIVRFARVDRPAALMQIPYLLWVTFAGYLNYMVWIMNG